jgi:hypothetical protein
MTMVEVLVAAAIGVVLTGMLVLIWIALSDSWTVTARGSESRDFARDAVARLSREVRDAEPKIGAQDAFLLAEPFKIQFTTTFNIAGNESSSTTPVLTEYEYVEEDRGDGSLEGVLYRRRDTDGVAGIGAGDFDSVVVRHLLNEKGEPPAEPVFVYTYIDDAGERQKDSAPTSLDNVLVVTVRLVVDVNPGKRPRPMDLTTTVQIRNQQ